MCRLRGSISVFACGLVCGLLAVGLPSARAQAFPSRAIRIVVGPSPDVIPRLYAEKMHDRWGTPVIVEPRPGAGGDIAAKAVAAAEPDGYTLLNATSSFTLNTAMHLAHYDFVKDFDPIAMINVSSFVLVVNKSVPANSVAELIALAKAKPGTLNCGSSGNGTPPHLGCEMFNKMAGVQTVHIPFREANSSIAALLGQHVQMIFALSTVVRGAIASGDLKALAVTTPQRSGIFPGLPTMAEAGLAGFEITGWGSLMAPAGTPKPVIEALNAQVVREASDPAIRQGLERMSLDPPPLYTPAEFADFIKKDIDRWNRIIDTAGVARAN